MQALRRVLELDHVWVSYSGSGRPAIADITFESPPGRLVLITGPNGAGKTTLLETCLGILKPFRGRVKLFGVDTRSWRVTKVRRLCSYVPQDFMKPPYESYTVRDVIAMGLYTLKSPFEPLSMSEEKLIEDTARILNIHEYLDTPIGRLSGGQQQRVFIARALIRRPRALFLDEPFSSIDRESRFEIAKVLKHYAEYEGALVMVVSHDVEPLEDLADVVIELNSGRVVRIEER